ncbi:hypothetical protein M758_1G010700 [Ceratodon purpureus]|nr:hypothetical protein M758_1G010700 [Ceratodon purpureus]
MGGSDFEEFELVEEETNWDGGEKEVKEVAKSPTTLVLVGRTGNGKSATGNSLLGTRVFKSRASSSAVTSTCELQETTRSDGRHLRVIDTPGLFDPNLPPQYIGKEIMKCLDLAKDGVHALLLVLSVRNRFTDEEIAAVESLQTIFGEKVVNYMVVVFTGGDDLEEDETLEEFLDNGAPTYLREFLKKCDNRMALFDNKTKDKTKQIRQTGDLLRVIDDMLLKNGGSPYANELFKEAQELAFKSEQEKKKLAARAAPGQNLQDIKRDLENTYAEQFKQLREMVEDKIRLNAERLEERLTMEQSAREAAEARARADKAQSEAELRALREELQRSNREREELSRKIEEQLKNRNCLIL